MQLRKDIYKKLKTEFMLKDGELDLMDIKINKRTQTAYVEFEIRHEGKAGRFWAIIEKQNKNLILAFWHPLDLEGGINHGAQRAKNKIPLLP